MFGEAGLHRLGSHHRQWQGGLAMGAFGAEPADMPVRFAATGAAVDDVEMIERLIAALHFVIAQELSRLIDGCSR